MRRTGHSTGIMFYDTPSIMHTHERKISTERAKSQTITAHFHSMRFSPESHRDQALPCKRGDRASTLVVAPASPRVGASARRDSPSCDRQRWHPPPMRRFAFVSLVDANAAMPTVIAPPSRVHDIAHSERTPTPLRAQRHTLHGMQTWVALPKSAEETAPAFHHHAASLPQQRCNGFGYGRTPAAPTARNRRSRCSPAR